MRFYLGCSGWFYRHWQNLFYPKNLPKKDWFKFYAKHFNTVELNVPFYRFPTERTAKAWLRSAPSKEFKFSIKANRLITHIKKFVGTKNLIKKFYNVCKILGDNLGCILFQLPPSLKFNLKKLKAILAQLDKNFTNVIEFRHESWWREETYALLKANETIFCIVSAPGLPEDFIKTAKDIYIRMHGKTFWYAYNYSKKELAELAEKIKNLKPRNAWVYFNNDYNAWAPANCLYLKNIFRKMIKNKKNDRK